MILDNSTPETHQVVKDSTAALLTNAMQDVIKKRYRYCRTACKWNACAFRKTGTSEFSTDLWLAAYTPYYTCSVWGGYDSSKPMENIYNQTWHEVIWKRIMDRVDSTLGLQPKNFTMPASVEQKTVCSQTGLLAVSSCPSYTEYFAKGTGPSSSCSGHYVEKEEDEEDKKEPEDKEDSEEEDDSGDGSEDSGNDNNNSGGNGGNGGDSGNGGTVTPPEES